MANFIHGKNTVVFLDGYDISGYLNSASYTMTADTAETTAFGANARSYIPSFPGGTISVGGMFDGTATGIDTILQTVASNQGAGGAAVPMSVAPQGNTVGNRVMLANVYNTSYSVSSPV